MLTQELENMVKSPIKPPKAPQKPARRLAYSRAPAGLPDDAGRDEVKEEFKRRLGAAMHRKGWNQSELARQASKHVPDDGTVERSVISHYMNAHVLPTPRNLHAISKALGVDPYDLLPTKGMPTLEKDLPPFEVKSVEGEEGMAWLRVNRRVPMRVALQIAGILSDIDEKK